MSCPECASARKTKLYGLAVIAAVFLVLALATLSGCGGAGPASRDAQAPAAGDSSAHAHPATAPPGSPDGGGHATGAAAPHVSASPLNEAAALTRARPVLEKYCAGCHTSAMGKGAALKHFSMDAYPFGGHHAATIGSTVREVLGAAGKPATMPKDDPGAVQGEELEAVLAWADSVAQPAATDPDDGHQH